MSRKKIYIILVSIILASSLVSCEKDVVLNLRSVDPRLVIDASIQENLSCMVYLTKTQDYYDNSYPILVQKATITLSDSEGTVEVLKETNPGVYQSMSIVGTPNRTYTISVEVEGKTYIATSTMPQTVEIDRLYIYNIPVGSDDYYSPCVVFDDPAEVKNYYSAILYINDRRLRTPYLFDDEYKNGMTTENILFYLGDDTKDEDLKIGDLVRVEMRTIDKGAYEYLTSLESVAAGGGTNPITNFSGDVLGCFNTYGISTMEIIITEDNIQTNK